MSATAREYYWGVELNESNREVVWDPEKDEQDDDDIDETAIQHFLFLKQAVLGKTAVDGERNIVEIGADDFDGNKVTQPLFSLKLGLNENIILDIGAQPPLTLKLVSGTGPVCLSGQHALELKDDDFDLLDDEADEVEESPVKITPKVQNNASKKRPAAAIEGPAKKAKLDKPKSNKPAEKPSEEVDEDDEDDEDDIDYSINMEDEDGEGGSSDEEEEDDSEDDKDDDDDDEGSEDSDDESPVKPPPIKKGKVNGAGPKGQQKKPIKKKEPPSLDDLKKLIGQSPGKPKKQSKFLNFIKSQYNVVDKKKGSDLWTWYKATLKD